MSPHITSTVTPDDTATIDREMGRAVWKRGSCRSRHQSASDHVIA